MCAYLRFRTTAQVRAPLIHPATRASPSRHRPAKCDPIRYPTPPCACPSATPIRRVR